MTQPSKEVTPQPHQPISPEGDLAIQVIAMPENTNPDGDIFGGWLLSQMDLAAGVTAKKQAKCRVVTIAINKMVFHNPVHVGDLVQCYSSIVKIGNKSIAIKVSAWVVDQITDEQKQVTEGIFTFVAIDENGKSQSVVRE